MTSKSMLTILSTLAATEMRMSEFTIDRAYTPEKQPKDKATLKRRKKNKAARKQRRVKR